MIKKDPLSRRRFIAAGGSAALAGLLLPSFAAANSPTFKIGYISPKTGPLAIFAEPDNFVMEQVRQQTAAGIPVGSERFPVEILYRDSQSSVDVAAQAARDLIVRDRVDIVLAASTPETTNPVADMCERMGVPCVTNDAPWQSYFFGRGGDPKLGFQWTYHFFWGLEDVIESYISLWQQIETNRRIGVLWPDDADGRVWADESMGFPPALRQAGFEIVDPGRFQADAVDFAGIVRQFREQEVDIVSGVLPPPFFQRFWTEALKQNFKPHITTVAKASEFPSSLLPFKRDANGLSVEVWWSPGFPFYSGLTGQSAFELAQAYTKSTGRNWTMPLGFKHALFEVALNALKHSNGPGRLESIRAALASTDYQSIAGRINFQTGPVPNISKTPLASGQWEYRYRQLELLVVDNKGEDEIPLQARLRSMR